jgi:putative FmdB family regulatory protein
MATYEYLCLSCERPFEERRAMSASVDTALACPACGSDRVRRRFSVFATSGEPGGSASPAAGGGCACGGACACGGH